MPKPSAVGVTLVLHVTLCLSIRVPVDWNASEVKPNEPLVNTNLNDAIRQNIPNQYFEYTAKKPQFAIDIAAAHNVKSPEKYYTSYPIKPYTGVNKPELGKHQMLNPEKESYYPYQNYVASGNDLSHVTPSSTAYDIYHPYKAEEPGLQEIYKDPVLDKIRNDLRDSKNRLQQYENDAGESDVTKEEYLETPEQTDHRYLPQKNIPSRYEIHRPMRRPAYYRPPPRFSYRENILNKKIRHPWNQNYAKVTPMHYRPIKNHLRNLRQHHAIKFDDENNEYPQLPVRESLVEKPDGFDIYEKGKDNFLRLRNNIDESINKAVLKNRPLTNEKLELKGNYDEHDSHEDDDEFIPIRNYAQVRKTETTKHLPRAAAFRDAESLDEIKNAPRLREAVKSTKAQVVYSEEGYEDSAYDHAGEQKHASDIEGHGGYLKEHELSGGKFQTPSVSAKIQDAGGSAHGDKLIHAEKWKDDNLENSEDSDAEDYSEDEQEVSEESDTHADNSNIEPNENNGETSEENINDDNVNEEISRNKREDLITGGDTNTSNFATSNKEHVVNKREYNRPKSYEEGIVHQKELTKNHNINPVKQKYPYYFKSDTVISNDSPLRYAENLSFIPNKTLGGTEFYDSRKEIVCPTIDEDVDPVPEKIKKGGNPDEIADDNKSKDEFSQLKNKQRLDGLGDKIDCLKSKYFGANPLDSPFFNEDIIESPEPVTKPNINLFDRDKTTQIILENHHKGNKNILASLESLGEQNPTLNKNQNVSHPLVFNKSSLQHNSGLRIEQNNGARNDIIPKTSISARKKRATPFIYEPYKIIRESQVAAESKKTTTTNNISPLIKQLQSSRVVDRVTANQNKDQITKRNASTKSYKNIGKVDREKQRKILSQDHQDSQESEILDVSLDKRRGEPRYEIEYKNHKSHYTPVKNKKSISLDEYKGRADVTKPSITVPFGPLPEETNYSHMRDTQKSAASNSVPKVIRKSTVKPTPSEEEDNDESEEEYDDYQNEEETDKKTHTSTLAPTTTTTVRPFRKEKQIRIKTSTDSGYYEEDTTTLPILRLKTRFRNSNVASELDNKGKIDPNHNNHHQKSIISSTTIAPKLSEKKKKLSKSTLVTDTKTYGEEDEDMHKEDIDALIGVKHNTDDYLPEYEKEQNENSKNSHEVESDEEEYDEDDSSEEDEDEDEDEDDDHDENVDDSREVGKLRQNSMHTTPEPTKRTLIKTTETSPSTTELNSNVQIKPIVSKKKIEVHRELPNNKLSPNVTHFKQDIKEIEITKTITPKMRQKPQKNLEALDLYKDENLAKDVNKLGGVEIFRPDLDIDSGPRHGGNYRSIESSHRTKETLKTKPVISQSQTTKMAELKESKNISHPLNAKRGGVLRNNKRFTKDENLNDEINTTPRQLHGGNLKISPRRSRIPTNKSEKIIELSENKAPLQLHGGNLKARNFPNKDQNTEEVNDKSEDIIENLDDANKNKSKRKTKHNSDSAAVLLNTYARAVPMLTTTTPFILDPSKRRYYYVDV